MRPQYVVVWDSDFNDISPIGDDVGVFFRMPCGVAANPRPVGGTERLLALCPLYVFRNKRVVEVDISPGTVSLYEQKGMRNLGLICEIINRHLQGDRDVLLCQDELIDAGYAEIARI